LYKEYTTTLKFWRSNLSEYLLSIIFAPILGGIIIYEDYVEYFYEDYLEKLYKDKYLPKLKCIELRMKSFVAEKFIYFLFTILILSVITIIQNKKLQEIREENKEQKAIIRSSNNTVSKNFKSAVKLLETNKAYNGILLLRSLESSEQYGRLAREHQVEFYANKKEYSSALNILKDYPSRFKDKEYYTKMGNFYINVGEIRKAVVAFEISCNKGSNEACSLFEEYNPYIKVVSYYTTLCCDGTTSSSKGRGTCSWHKGVCDWEYPIYVKQRKYK